MGFITLLTFSAKKSTELATAEYNLITI